MQRLLLALSLVLCSSVSFGQIFYSKNDLTIWSSNGDGSTDTFITNGYYPKVSNDGHYMVFLRGGSSDLSLNDIYLRDLVTNAESMIFDNNDHVISFGWTSDGSKIIFDYGCQIWTMNRDGSGVTGLTFFDCYDDVPSFRTSDGKIVHHNQFYGIITKNADGSSSQTVPNTQPGDYWPTWSPDGQWISFSRNSTATGGVFVAQYKIKPDGSGLTRLTPSLPPGQTLGTSNAWTSDGAHIIMTGIGCTSGFFEIPADGSQVMKRLDDLFSGAAPDYIGSIIGTPTLSYRPLTCYPLISSFSPASGPVGTTVTITGGNFSSTAANNIVYFGATKATVTSATTSQLIVTVPTGATYDPITVTVDGLIGYADKPFLTTFPGGGTINSCTLAPAFNLAVSSLHYGLNAVDYDGDGKVDMATTTYPSNQIQIFRNTSVSGSIDASSFASAVSLSTPGGDPYTIRSADLDGDGKTDIILSMAGSGQLALYRNTSTPGNLSFESYVSFAAGSDPLFAAVNDMDADGKGEILVVNRFSNTLSIYKNTTTSGAFTASSFAAKVDFAVGAEPYVVRVADLNGDTKPDVVVTNLAGNSLSVFENVSVTGVINSSSLASPVTLTTGTTPHSTSLSDIDGDGRIDIAVATIGSNIVSVFKNVNSSGTITSASFQSRVDFPAGSGAVDIAAADLDGDGKVDLVVSNQSDNTFSLFKNTSTTGVIDASTFAARIDFTNGPYTAPLALVDIDGDGKTDVIASSVNSSSVNIYRNIADKPVASITSFTPSSGVAGSSITISGANFDPTPANNSVKFNGVAATVTASTTTSITVTVPFGIVTSGPITVTVNCHTATSSTNFTVNSAASFGNTITTNGTTDYVIVSDHAALRPLNMTIEAWVNFSSVSGIQPIVNKVLGTGNSDTYQLFYNGGALWATAMDDNGFNGFASYTFTPVTGQWYHFAFTYNDATKAIILYINGVVVGTHTAVASPGYDAGAVFIGGDLDFGTSYNLFNGKLDEVRIWNTDRLQAAIQSTMNTTLTGSETNLVAYYKMDEVGAGAGITVKNSATTGAALNGITMGTSCTPIFTVQTITSFTPSNAQVGTTVTITGTNFDLVPANNIVKFNGVTATITSATATTLTTTVPAGATTGTIAVTIGCTTITSSTPITICTAPAAPIATGSARCGAGTVTLTASGGSNGQYRWYTTTTGSPIAGEVNSTFTTPVISTSTTYYVSINNGSCESTQTPVTATINTIPVAPITTGASRCGTGTVTLTASGGSNGEYRWYATTTGSPIAGEVNSTFTTPLLSVSTTYYVTINNGNCESAQTPVTATINMIPVVPITSGASRCGAGTVTLTASEGSNGEYRWYTTTTGSPIAGEVNSTFTTSLLSVSTTYYVSINNGSCESTQTPVTATINTIPTAPTTTSTSRCGDGTVTLIASGGSNGQYRWYTTTTGSPITGEVNSTFTTPLISVSTTYYVSINDGSCESAQTPVTATINTIPTAPVTTGTSGCSSSAITLTASGGVNGQYRWYDVVSGGTALAGQVDNTFVTPVLLNNTTYFVAINNGVCESTRTPVTAVIQNCITNQPPDIKATTIEAPIEGKVSILLTGLLSDSDNNLDFSTLRIVVFPSSGASASINAQHDLILDYTGISFSGTEKLTIEVCDAMGACTQKELSIEVIGDVIVYNGISPNGDKQNDLFLLKYIDDIEETKNNHVYIYNRWGDLIFDVTNYDNKTKVFTGLNNNGNEVPTGTYFYKVEFASGRKPLTGYLSLKR